MPNHFMTELKRFWQICQTSVHKKWNRTLPFGDYVIDRWEKAEALNFGKGSSIYDASLVIGDVVVGENVWIGPFTVLDGSGGLTIGNNCSISAGVQIYTHDSVDWALSGGKEGYRYAPTAIGNNCYIGPQTVVKMGVTIEDCCVIGSHSLVTENIPKGSKAFGVPCKVQGTAQSNRRQSE